MTDILREKTEETAQRVSPPTPAQWVRRAVAGDEGAFEKLYAHFHRDVWRVGARVLPTAGDRQELVQDTFAIAATSLRKLRNPARVRAWLRAIALRTALRQQRRASRDAASAALQHHWFPSAHDPTSALEARSAARALAEMPPSLRDPWMLARVEGVDLQRTADLCGVSLSTVKRRLREADKTLQVLQDG